MKLSVFNFIYFNLFAHLFFTFPSFRFLTPYCPLPITWLYAVFFKFSYCTSSWWFFFVCICWAFLYAFILGGFSVTFLFMRVLFWWFTLFCLILVRKFFSLSVCTRCFQDFWHRRRCWSANIENWFPPISVNSWRWRFFPK